MALGLCLKRKKGLYELPLYIGGEEDNQPILILSEFVTCPARILGRLQG